MNILQICPHCLGWTCCRSGSLPRLNMLQIWPIAWGEHVADLTHCLGWTCCRSDPLPGVNMLQIWPIAWGEHVADLTRCLGWTGHISDAFPRMNMLQIWEVPVIAAIFSVYAFKLLFSCAGEPCRLWHCNCWCLLECSFDLLTYTTGITAPSVCYHRDRIASAVWN